MASDIIKNAIPTKTQETIQESENPEELRLRAISALYKSYPWPQK